MAKTPKISTDNTLAGKVTVYRNLDQNIIHVSEDRIRLCLLKHQVALESRKSWIAPFGILVTLATTLVSSDFHEKILSPSVWSAIYVICCALSAIWLLIDLYKLIRRWKDVDFDRVIENLKNNDGNQNT